MTSAAELICTTN